MDDFNLCKSAIVALRTSRPVAFLTPTVGPGRIGLIYHKPLMIDE
jgi:hypothetical protein